MNRYRLNVADRTTGAESVIELDAESEAAAVKLAGARGFLIEHVVPVAARPTAPITSETIQIRLLEPGEEPPLIPAGVTIPYATPVTPAPVRFDLSVLFKIILGIIVLAVIVGVIAANNTKVPLPATPAVAPPLAGPASNIVPITVTKRWYENNRGQVLQTAYEIRNDSLRPLVINRVTFNTDFVPSRARHDLKGFHLIDDFTAWPVTLAAGESVFVWKEDVRFPAEQRNYTRHVLVMNVDTSAGTHLCTFDD